MRIRILFPFLALLMLSLPAVSQDSCYMCMPVSTVHNAQLYNPCANATSGDYCVGQIRKMTVHTVMWPDPSLPQQIYLLALGSAECASTCNYDWIGAPYRHTQCWPQFYSPIKTPGNYYSAAHEALSDPILAWCYATPYVWAIYCSTGALSYISVDHSCACMSPDMDGDGFASYQYGGSDCNDSMPFIYPGAPPVCYPGYDANCNGAQDFLEYACTNSPVIIDIGADGIELTSKTGGVLFDLDGDGTREQLSWTSATSEDAWLCLDRNGNGSIDNGKELFGSYTEQPDPPEGTEPNGFIALAEFDKPENGGNEDGIIDARDSVYQSLQLWQDTNHNGTSEAGELRPLQSFGVEAINLDYRYSRIVDEFGNQFRYRTRLKLKNRTIDIGAWAWDVFLIR